MASALGLTGRRGPPSASAASELASGLTGEEMTSSGPSTDMEVTQTEVQDGFLDRGSGRTAIALRGLDVDDSPSGSHAGWVVVNRRSRPTKRDSTESSQQVR